MKIIASGMTDVGRSRRLNEDSLLVDVETGLFAVCDGLGGHSAGEIASSMAVSIIAKSMADLQGQTTETSARAQRLADSVRRAGSEIYGKATSDESYSGMGTTATAAVFGDDTASIAHVGDSRAYRLRGDELEQLSQDHSLVAEQVRDGIITPEDAARSPYRNVITRALGIKPDVAVDLYDFKVSAGDRFLLCSDGLTAVLSDNDIRRVVASEDKPEAACERLVRQANEQGGPDNITVVLIYVTDG